MSEFTHTPSPGYAWPVIGGALYGFEGKYDKIFSGLRPGAQEIKATSCHKHDGIMQADTMEVRPAIQTIPIAPSAPVSIPDVLRFQVLRRSWHQERGSTSSITDMAICPSYQKIVGMGEKAVPLILRQLEIEWDDPDHWSWALSAITGEDPVTEDILGNTRKMAAAWIAWARNKYAW